MGMFSLYGRKDDPIPAHSQRIFTLAAQAADGTRTLFKKQGEEISTTAWIGVLMEYQNLYIQLTDRALFGRIPDAKRNTLLQDFATMCIDTSISTICKGWGDERIRRVQAECKRNYGISLTQDYGQCAKLFPDKGEGTGGTMIWEFSKTVAAIAGHEMDAAYVTFFSQIVDFEGLELPKFVNDAARVYA